MTAANLTNLELEILKEMVGGTLESLQTEGADRPDNPTFIGYCNLYRKLGGVPPAPSEPKLSPAERESAIGLADDLINIAQNGGSQDA